MKRSRLYGWRERKRDRMKARLKDVLLRNPSKFQLSYREAVKRLYELGVEEHDLIVLGKHPYYWMRLDEIKSVLEARYE